MFDQADPTFALAMDRLQAGEKSYAPESPSTPPTEESAPQPPTAPAEPETTTTQPPVTEPETPGTPATTETPAQPETEPTGKRTDFSKNQERLQGGWKQLNARKEEQAKLEADLKRQTEEFNRQKVAFEKQQADARKSQVRTPEHYEAEAAKLEKNAEIADKKGDFEAADEIRAIAKASRRFAAELRANPPAPDKTVEEATKAFDDEQKKWTSKAAIDYPDLAKKESPSMARLKAMITPGSDSYDAIVHEAVRTSPAGMYYASMLAHNMTVAARVPTLEKELADARAEVKKLNGKLAVNGNGLATTEPAKPDARSIPLENLGDQLRRDAANQPAFR